MKKNIYRQYGEAEVDQPALVRLKCDKSKGGVHKSIGLENREG